VSSAYIITGDVSYVGLFSYTQKTAMITDLNVEAMIEPSSKAIAVGGIVGDNYGIINKCTFKGTVRGNNYVGGIAGFNETGALIIDCISTGNISGKYYTGGICGENAGGISGCVNGSSVNTVNDDTVQSLSDIDLDLYKEKLMALFKEDDTTSKSETDRHSNPTDTGGIAGLSIGAIGYCTNNGDIGYDHVGYNTGGIAGRSSGYLFENINNGNVKGRKDIGGIAGQAEPYVQLDLTEDIIAQITDNVNKLHDLIDTTLNDAGACTDTISMRLNVVKSFADRALSDTNYLADSTIGFVDGTVSAANDALNRIEYVISESSKRGGVIDSTRSSISDFKNAFNSLKQAVDDADAYSYLSDSEKAEYDAAKQNAENATAEYEGYMDSVTGNRAYYYRNLSKNVNDSTKSYYGAEDDLYFYHDNNDGTYIQLAAVGSIDPSDVENYNTVTIDGVPYSIDGAAHFDDAGNKTDFPSSEEGMSEYDRSLDIDASADVARDAEQYADQSYEANHPGQNYRTDMTTYMTQMTSLLTLHESELREAEEKDLTDAVKQASNGVSELENAGNGIKGIANDLNSMGDIRFNMLGSEYQARANSLNANMQGISDNLGHLNAEMSSATDVMINDLAGVNDQFNTLMLLFTDAMDGALEMDYSTIYEDNSEDVAETCVDGTVDKNINYGLIEGDIDTAGIIGTMAIDYDFDSESDATGVKDSRANASYITKCVARDNENRGRVHSLKSYCGGVTGLQEMGTILRCQCFGNVFSDSGEYVGGIAGRSLSTIRNCYSKGVYEGTRYVGGIAGKSAGIYDSCAMPDIRKAGSYYGAIAGASEDNAIIKGNYFVSADLSGIDRISYSGKAEPLSYSELTGLPGIPDDFGKMNITFTSEGDPVGSASVQYGGTITEDLLPDVDTEEDSYVKWDIPDDVRVLSDMEIAAVKCRYLTTLADERLRDDGQSVILADGRFLEGDKLEVKMLAPLTIPLSSVKEAYSVTNPSDGSSVHTLRYHPLTENSDTEIYVNNNGRWQKTGCETFGRYILFNYSGDSVEFCAVAVKKDIRGYIIAGSAAAFITAVILYLIVLNKKRKKNSKK
ncbi:MAG: hypothetical protein K5886_01075, partial [Lachnospiraceae bacterium]|nr:hypothetical protein [Lachnospiraceae bacterium]